MLGKQGQNKLQEAVLHTMSSQAVALLSKGVLCMLNGYMSWKRLRELKDIHQKLLTTVN